jgi:zinc/manganese transport system substrate-binding protein
VVALVVALAATACGPGGATSASGSDTSRELSIVVTTTILADVTGHVAGDSAQVTTLMEAGADPHNFEASAQALALMQDADLIVANGAGLEEQLQSPIAEAERSGVPVFHATDHIETLAFTGAEGHDDEPDHDGDEAGAVDPHFWMDPTRMADVARALGAQIGPLSNDAGAIGAQAGDYAARLEQADAEITRTLAPIPEGDRTLVTNHEAFNYFAERYDFTIVGTVIPGLSTGAEPSARDLEELVHTIERQQVSAVFTENTAPEQLTQTLAAEVGSDVEVIELYSDSVGDDGSGATTYLEMLTANAELISGALGG